MAAAKAYNLDGPQVRLTSDALAAEFPAAEHLWLPIRMDPGESNDLFRLIKQQCLLSADLLGNSNFFCANTLAY